MPKPNTPFQWEPICEERELTFVHPFDDVDVMAGQGTVALEMLEDVPDLDILPIPIGARSWGLWRRGVAHRPPVQTPALAGSGR